MNYNKCARCKSTAIVTMELDDKRSGAYQRTQLCKRHYVLEGLPLEMLQFFLKQKTIIIECQTRNISDFKIKYKQQNLPSTL